MSPDSDHNSDEHHIIMEKPTGCDNDNNEPSMAKGKEKLVTDDDDDDDNSSDDENDDDAHAIAARQRRKRIKTLFGSLNAMLPHVPTQADRVTVVDETLNYIKVLEQTLEDLEKKKLERQQLLQSSVVVVPNNNNNAGTSREAFMADQVAASSPLSLTPNPCPHQNYYNYLHSPAVEFRTWTSVNVVLNTCGQNAQFSICSSKNSISTICSVLQKYDIDVLTAHISSDDHGRRFYMFQAHVNEIPGALPAEEAFKRAAHEIILCLS